MSKAKVVAAQFAQGDLLIMKADKATSKKGYRKRLNGVLAYGEVTGHSHRVFSPGGSFDATVWEPESGTGDLLVEVEAEEGVQVVHEEHGTINLPQGTYTVRRQREYTPEEIRQVAD
jgi:hypothetical protein